MVKELKLGRNSGPGRPSQRHRQLSLFNAARENSALINQSMLTSKPNAGVKDSLPTFQTFVLTKTKTASAMEESCSDKNMRKVRPTELK
jgi:hypothetical protein